MRPALSLPALILPLLLAGCGDAPRDDHYANKVEPAPAVEVPPMRHVVAVRIGEMGPSFDACVHAGTTRHVPAGQSLPVRAAPFESAEETGAVASGARFHVCSRSQDQKWLGIVFDEAGTLAPACGVSSPVTSRRNYEGPCRSGWVASAFVRLIAGVDQPPPENPNPAPPGAAGG
jgi:hypothetical protein